MDRVERISADGVKQVAQNGSKWLLLALVPWSSLSSVSALCGAMRCKFCQLFFKVARLNVLFVDCPICFTSSFYYYLYIIYFSLGVSASRVEVT